MRPIGIAAVVAALACSACGSGEAESTPDERRAADAPTRTASGPASVSSYRFTTAHRRTSGGERSNLRCEGAADASRDRFELTCERLDEPGGYAAVVIGRTTYLKPGGEELFARSEDGGTPSELTPSTLFERLRRAGGQQTRVGHETIRGVSTIHYSLTVDCERAGLSDCSAGRADVDVWVDDDQIARRARVRQSGSVSTVDYYDFGADVDITPPSPDELYKPGGQPPDCAFLPNAGEPISVLLALDTLRSRGLRVWLKEDCHGTTVSGITGWIGPPSGQGAGQLNCSVESSPPEGVSLTRVTGSTAPQGSDVGPDATRKLGNLECSLGVLGAPYGGDLERLDAAFEDLRRRINP